MLEGEVPLSEVSPCSPSGDEPSADVATSPDSFSAVVGTEAFGSAELEAGASVAVSPPPQAATSTATAQTMAVSLISKNLFLNTKNKSSYYVTLH